MGRTAEAGRTGTSGPRTLPAALFATVLHLSSVLASIPAHAADPCTVAPGDAPARVVSVDATLDIRLDDGRVLRLAGIDVPRPREGATDPAALARDVLAAWAGTGPVLVRPLAAAPDRWGRIPAMLFRPDAAGPSAAAMLLDAGRARARPDPAIHPCFAALLDAEERARAAGRGIWTDAEAKVLRADDADGLARASGGFALVEGTLHVHAARGALYLTLGRDRWGFAGVLTRRDAARFAKDGFDVADYDGAPVRLRGDLDDRFGARIRLTDPDQLQSLEPGALEAPPR